MLGWAIVLVGAIIMSFTDFYIIDSLMSIGVAMFILINAIKNLKDILDIILEKVPCNIDVEDLQKHILKNNDILDIHHIHIWSMDGYNNYATMHIITNQDANKVKDNVRNELIKYGICHATIEIETEDYEYNNKLCYNKTHHIKHRHHNHNHQDIEKNEG